jgi:hypothetical protein
MSEFIESLPEEIRGSEHLSDIEDATTLATKYVEKMSTPSDLASQLPEDLRKNETFKDMDVGKLATSYLDIQGKVPKVPGSPDEYSFDFPEDAQIAEADHKVFKETALQIGLTQDQFEKLVEFDISRIGRIMESFEAEKKETWKQIGQELDLSEDEIKTRVEDVGKALGWDKTIARMDLQSDPDFIKGLLTIKEKISEDVLKTSTSTGQGRPKGPDGRPRLEFPDMD